MYKLSKCFNTTFKFLNKSRISKLLLELNLKLLTKNEANKKFKSKLLLKSQSNFLPGTKVTISIYTTEHFLPIKLQADPGYKPPSSLDFGDKTWT